MAIALLFIQKVPIPIHFVNSCTIGKKSSDKCHPSAKKAKNRNMKKTLVRDPQSQRKRVVKVNKNTGKHRAEENK